MKKVTTWLAVISVTIFFIDWIYIGLKLLDGDYDITFGAYLAAVCLIIFFPCALYKKFLSARCPHCKKLLLQNGRYCPHCGKEI